MTTATQLLPFPPELERLFAPPFDATPRWGWSVSIEGRPWSIATDSRSLLALAMASGLPPPGDDSPGARKLPAVLEAPAEGPPVLADAATLRAWAGPVPEARTEACDCCAGSGTCVCDHCDVKHECGNCNGAGRLPAYSPRPQVIAGLLVDAGRLARLLDGRPDGPCAATRRPMTPVEGKAATALRLDGEGWFALVMELSGERAGRPEFGSKEVVAP